MPTLVCLGILWAPAALPRQALPVAPGHEQPATQPWMPRPEPAPAGVIAHCGAWERAGFKSLQVNVDARGCNISGDAANEPSIAVSATDPRKIVIGWRQFDSVLSDFRQAGCAYSHDGGHTWMFKGSLTPGIFGSDPVLVSGAADDVYYLSTNFDETRLFRSFDGGITWPVRTQAIPSLYDKPWMAVDRTVGEGRGNIYLTSMTYGGFFRSLDSGNMFTAYPTPGLYGDTISVAADGGVYLATGVAEWTVERSKNAADPLATPSFAEVAYLRMSSWSISRFGPPSNPGGLIGQLWVATRQSLPDEPPHVLLFGVTQTDPAGEDPADSVFIRSVDGGETWGRPVVVNDDPPSATSWQWFNTMSVAPNGRVDAAWNDTRNYPAAPNMRLSELYYARSSDGGVTWSANLPVSPVFDSHAGWPSGQTKIGDYYHMVSDNLGVNVAYSATFNGEQDIYFLRIGPWDCNGNEIDDAVDISEARSADCNANEVPDECEYRVDVNGDGLTTLSDFIAFRAALTGPSGPCATAVSAVGGGQERLTDRTAWTIPSSLRRSVASSLRRSFPQSTIDNRQSTIGNRQLPIPCFDLLDPDHDGDVDLHDFYLLEHVFVAP